MIGSGIIRMKIETANHNGVRATAYMKNAAPVIKSPIKIVCIRGRVPPQIEINIAPANAPPLITPINCPVIASLRVIEIKYGIESPRGPFNKK